MKSSRFKFRAWDKGVNRIYTSEYIKEMSVFALNPTHSNNDFLVLPIMSDVILMQYTGLKDKNGVEIYEGDILKRYISNYRSLEDCIGYVEFTQASFFFVEHSVTKPFVSDHALGSECKDYLGMVRCVSYEVIGNIYENPELIPAVTPS